MARKKTAKWIKIRSKNTLPPPEIRVLVTDGEQVHEAYITHKSEWAGINLVNDEVFAASNITHYKELPPPPKRRKVVPIFEHAEEELEDVVGMLYPQESIEQEEFVYKFMQNLRPIEVFKNVVAYFPYHKMMEIEKEGKALFKRTFNWDRRPVYLYISAKYERNYVGRVEEDARLIFTFGVSCHSGKRKGAEAFTIEEEVYASQLELGKKALIGKLDKATNLKRVLGGVLTPEMYYN